VSANETEVPKKPTQADAAPEASNSRGESLPPAFRSAKRWSSRTQSVQLFGAVRHSSRADVMGATWQAGSWNDSSDFRRYPYDAPLSDEGRQEAKEIAERVDEFLDSRSRADLQVVVCSPYLRCVETAVAICQRLGSSRLMIDLGLGEVYGPQVFGDTEPEGGIVRPLEELEAYLRQVWKVDGFHSPVSVVGSWPKWPEGLGVGRKRYAERLLAYLNRGEKARRNFLLVSHADCVASVLALLPAEGGRVVESVGYGGMVMACRMALPTSPARALPVLLGSPTSSTDGDEDEVEKMKLCGQDECSVPLDHAVIKVPSSSSPCRLPSDQRAWWGHDGQDVSEGSPRRQLRISTDGVADEAFGRQLSAGSFPEDEILAGFRQLPWQMEVWNVKLGHRWCNGSEHAVANAMAALESHGKKKNGPVPQSKVEQLLGVLSKERLGSARSLSGFLRDSLTDSSGSQPDPVFGKTESQVSTLSYETYLFGCSELSVSEASSLKASMKEWAQEERVKAPVKADLPAKPSLPTILSEHSLRNGLAVEDNMKGRLPLPNLSKAKSRLLQRRRFMTG